VLPALLLAGALFDGFRRLSFVSLAARARARGARALGRAPHRVLRIGAAFVLGDYASGLDLGPPRAPGSAPRSRRAASQATLCAASARLSPIAASPAHPSDWITPRGLAFVREHVRGNVLNAYHLGGVLIYFGYPQLRRVDRLARRPVPVRLLPRAPRRALRRPRRDARVREPPRDRSHRGRAPDLRPALRGPRVRARGFALVYADELTLPCVAREAGS
jgi:hypothetical protein